MRRRRAAGAPPGGARARLVAPVAHFLACLGVFLSQLVFVQEVALALGVGAGNASGFERAHVALRPGAILALGRDAAVRLRLLLALFRRFLLPLAERGVLLGGRERLLLGVILLVRLVRGRFLGLRQL